MKLFDSEIENLSLELSTKILVNEARKLNYKVEILSEADNAIRISNNTKQQIVIQATKTNADNYANILIMENKYLTKLLLAEQNIKVPVGIKLNKKDDYDLTQCLNEQVVIKPLNTNFGLGISIFKNNDHTIEDLQYAVNRAFEYDQDIIIEQYQHGEEYRFLIIDDECLSIINRKPANVVGDGKSTIEQLIAIKNENPLRGENYAKPLEKIKVDDDVLNNLQLQSKSLNSVLEVDEYVYLRTMSNVSQGGESHEVSHLIADNYKQIAIKAAASIGVKICGVDMIIDQATGNYNIIELNFNPAIHMHMYPEFGQGYNVANKILQLLFKEGE